MANYLLKLWTGPCYVKDVAQTLRRYGFTVPTEGTEHVYFEQEGNTDHDAETNAIIKIRQQHGGSDLGLPVAHRKLS